MSKKMADYVASRPRLAGILFMVCLLLMQMGTVAGEGNVIVGP